MINVPASEIEVDDPRVSEDLDLKITQYLLECLVLLIASSVIRVLQTHGEGLFLRLGAFASVE